MSDIYTSTLSAGGDSGNLDVTAATPHGINVTGKAVVEVQHDGGWKTMLELGEGASDIIFPTHSTIRIRDLSGAANAVSLHDSN
ncbi:MAG: hypothetical protein AAGI48_03780 [Verrucomicrobiota bacterium]